MLDVKPVESLLVTHFQLPADLTPQTDEEKYISRVPYVSVVENIMYFMVCAHPDISHAASVVNRHMDRPKKVIGRQ